MLEISTKDQSIATVRNVNVELLRCIAILFVILIHLSSPFFYNKSIFEDHSHYWIINNFYYAFSRFSVPVFFMVTAHIYFKSNGNYNIVKRLNKLIVPLLFWSGVYFYYGDYAGSHGVIEYFKSLIFSRTSTHLWFIPVFIGYIVLLPLMKSYFVDSKDNGKLIVGCSIIFYISIIPFIASCLTAMGYDSSFIWGVKQYNVSIAEFMVFPIVIFFSPLVRDMKSSSYILMFIITCTSIAILNMYSSYAQSLATESFFNYTSPLVILSALCTYKYILSIKINSMKAIKAINMLGSLSFGIYLSHIMVRNILQHYELISWSSPIISPIVNTISIIIISAIIVFIIKKTPYIKAIC